MFLNSFEIEVGKKGIVSCIKSSGHICLSGRHFMIDNLIFIMQCIGLACLQNYSMFVYLLLI